MKKFNLSKGLIVGLLTFALSIVAFAAVGASADEAAQAVTPPAAIEATYTYDDNSISATANAYVYVLKAEKGNEIKAGAKAAGTIAAGKKTALTDLKIKGTAKDVYLYVCDKEFEAAGKADANLVIKAQAAKKVVGVIDYTKADKAGATNVLSITATDKSKKAIENPVCIWSEEIDGTSAASATFTGEKLAKMLGEGGGVIYVKMVGADDPAQFASKAIKVKIAKPAKAPKVKYDQKKDAIALKNGFDFALATKNNDKYTVENWFTILPVNKDAKTKEAADSIVATTNFVPLDKKAANALKAASENEGKVSYTQYKFKSLAMEDILQTIGKSYNETFTLAVRKSATAKKPASEVTYIEFAGQTEAPIVYTAANVAGEFEIATTTDFEKKGFTIGTVVNFNGAEGTEGYDDSFKLKATAGEGADKNAAAYEFCVVKAEDLWKETPINQTESTVECIIDWTSVSWKKLDPAKTKITGKLKTKYNTSEKTGVEAVLNAMAAPDTEEKKLSFNQALAERGNVLPDGVSTVLLVRRAGVKGDTPVRPSAPIALFVVKDGKNYTLYSTQDNGESAYKYTVEFYRYTAPAEGNVYTYKADEAIEVITGFGKNSTEYVTFPEIANADFFELTVVNDGTLGDKLVKQASGENKDKYPVVVEATAKNLKVAIREYANVTIKAIFGTVDAQDEFTPIDELAQDVAVVINGKVATYNGTKKAYEVDAETEVSIWADKALDSVVIRDITAIPGYLITGTYSKVASDASDLLEVDDSAVNTSKTLKFKAKSGEPVVIEIKKAVVKQYTITVDPNGGTLKGDLADKNGKLTTDADGKVAGLAGTSLTPPTNKEFKEFNTKADGTGDVKTAESVFTADTTVFAIWQDVTPAP